MHHADIYFTKIQLEIFLISWAELQSVFSVITACFCLCEEPSSKQNVRSGRQIPICEIYVLNSDIFFFTII